MKNVETEDKWTLRPGDFRPERLNDILDIIGYSKRAVEQMRISGNLFDSKDEAIEASIAVRAELTKMQFIRQERRGYSQQNGHPGGTN